MRSVCGKENRKNPVLDMTKGSTFRNLLRFSLPLFWGNLLQQFYNLADTAIAGHLLGDMALAQIGSTAALYSLVTNIAFGLNNGYALSVSRAFGEGNQEKVRRSVRCMVILSVSAGMVMAVAFLLFLKPLSEILQIPKNCMDGAVAYLSVILTGIPFTMAYNMEAALLQAVGNSKIPLWLLLSSSILNVVLDYLFMGTFHMGVRGAAIATILAQGICAGVGLFYILHFYSFFSSSEKVKLTFEFAIEMFWMGLSMALMSAIYNIGSVVLQGSINALGEIYIAAQVGARRLAEFFYTPGLAIGTAAATFAGQNYGAGRKDRIRKGTAAAILLYGIWWLFALFVTFAFADKVVRLITGSRNPEVIRAAVLYLKISIPMIPPMAVLVILRNVLQGMKYSVAPLFCSGMELAGKILFAVYVVPRYGYTAVCICEPVTWVICFLFITVVAVGVWKKEIKSSLSDRYTVNLRK